ncbi:MAG: MarR family transcriptional regulator [Actinobacteria bacterium]|nr:MarR family transcriptional regulator [Actinomycetota bacterium]
MSDDCASLLPVDPPPPRAPADVEEGAIRTFGLLLEAHTRITRLLDADLQRSTGISLQTLEVLLRVSRAPWGVMTMSELADQVALSTGGVTRLADRLSDDGLVERRACPEDRRRVHLGLTPRGVEVLEQALTHHVDALDTHVMRRIDPADLAGFERVLDALRTAPDLHGATPGRAAGTAAGPAAGPAA